MTTSQVHLATEVVKYENQSEDNQNIAKEFNQERKVSTRRNGEPYYRLLGDKIIQTSITSLKLAIRNSSVNRT